MKMEDGGRRMDGRVCIERKRKRNQDAATWNLYADLIVYSETKEGCG